MQACMRSTPQSGRCGRPWLLRANLHLAEAVLRTITLLSGFLSLHFVSLGQNQSTDRYSPMLDESRMGGKVDGPPPGTWLSLPE